MSLVYDIERELERKMIKGLRNIFELDDLFKYNKNISDAGVVITTDFPEKEIPLKKPHIIVSDISFENDTQTTFSNNVQSNMAGSSMQSNLPGNSIGNYGTKHISITPYNLNITCLGLRDISRNLANRVYFYINYKAYDYLSNRLGLEIGRVRKNPTSPTEQYPEKIFSTTISISGTATFGIDKTPFNYSTAKGPTIQDFKGDSFVKAKLTIKDS